VSHDNEIVGNTFLRCAGSAVVDSTNGDDPLAGKVSNALISGNTFIDCDQAVSLYWQNADGTPAHGGPAVLLRNASYCIVSGNNYVQSGLVSASQAVNDNDVPILLIISDHCAINESKGSFPNSGLPKEWVIDIDGSENLINTRDRTLYRGKSMRGGVSQRKPMKQHTKLHEYHNSYRF